VQIKLTILETSISRPVSCSSEVDIKIRIVMKFKRLLKKPRLLLEISPMQDIAKGNPFSNSYMFGIVSYYKIIIYKYYFKLPLEIAIIVVRYALAVVPIIPIQLGINVISK
jgi:hypothetical protein